MRRASVIGALPLAAAAVAAGSILVGEDARGALDQVGDDRAADRPRVPAYAVAPAGGSVPAGVNRRTGEPHANAREIARNARRQARRGA